MSVATIIVIIAVVIGFELAATITWVFAQMAALPVSPEIMAGAGERH